MEWEPEARDTSVTEAGAGLRARDLWATGCATPGLEEGPQFPHRVSGPPLAEPCVCMGVLHSYSALSKRQGLLRVRKP